MDTETISQSGPAVQAADIKWRIGAVFVDRSLRFDAKISLLALTFFADGDGRVEMPKDDLVRLTRLTGHKVNGALNWLSRKGYISRDGDRIQVTKQ